MSKHYQALTICSSSGRTFWNQAKPSIEAVYKHLDRYLRKTSDILIYEISDTDPIKCVDHIKTHHPSKENKLSGRYK